MKTENNNSRIISFSRGQQLVTIGDIFEWWGMDKPTYEVVSFSDDHRSYSPSGLGGAIGVVVRDLRTGKTEEWCGDSVASGVSASKRNTQQK